MPPRSPAPCSIASQPTEWASARAAPSGVCTVRPTPSASPSSWRAAIQHPREPLRARTAKIEAKLDEALERMRGRTLQGHVDLTPSQWKDLASAGLLGAGIATEHGGLELEPLLHSDLVARASGCAVPVAEAIAESGPGGFADLITTFGTDQQRETLLPRVARGEALGALAWTGIDQLPGESFATVVRTRQGGKEVLAARLQFSFDAVELAHALEHVDESIHVVAVDRPDVAHAELLEDVAGNEAVAPPLADVVERLVDLAADERDRLDEALGLLTRALNAAAAADPREVLRQRADRLGDRPLVVVEDDEQLRPRRARVVERLERNAGAAR